MLSYETDQMTRNEIVKATYLSAQRLNQFKLKYGLADRKVYEDVDIKIIKSLEFIDRLDEIMLLPQEEQQKALLEIKSEVLEVNRHSICGKNELKWEVKKLYANIPSLTKIGLDLLIEEMAIGIKCKLGVVDRHKATIK